MRKLLLAPIAALALVACTGQGVSSAGSKAVIGADGAYIAASRAGMALVSIGRLDRQRFRAADDRAYTALLLVRLAARGGVGSEVATASERFNQALADLSALSVKN